MVGDQRKVSTSTPALTSESAPKEVGSDETAQVPVKLVPGCPLSRTTSAAGCVTVKTSGTEVPPPGPGVNTVTSAVPVEVRSVEARLAWSSVALTKVVGRFPPPQRTTDDGVNPSPSTVSRKPGPPTLALLGVSAARTLSPVPRVSHRLSATFGSVPRSVSITSGTPSLSVSTSGSAGRGKTFSTYAVSSASPLQVPSAP